MIMKKKEYDAVKNDLQLIVQCVRCGELLQGSHVILEHKCPKMKERYGTLKRLIQTKAPNLTHVRFVFEKKSIAVMLDCDSTCHKLKIVENDLKTASDSLSPEEIEDVKVSEKEFASGKYKVFGTAEDLIADLHKTREKVKK